MQNTFYRQVQYHYINSGCLKLLRKSIAEKITDSLIDNSVIAMEDRALYSYGLQQGMVMLLNIFITMLIGILMGMFWQSILFLAAYIPLRSYAGGYHAKTQLRCDLISILLIVAALMGTKFIYGNEFTGMLILLGSGTAVFFLAPVEDLNKQLNKREIESYKKKTRVLLCLILGLACFSRKMGLPQAGGILTMVPVILSLLLILGKIKNAVILRQFGKHPSG